MNDPVKKHAAEKEWLHKLLLFVSAFLVIETVTGLSIYFLPFSLSNQVMVLIHSVAGLLFTIPFLWYLVRHILVYNWRKLDHFKFTGYVALILGLALTVSGLIVTWQAVFASKISPTWDLIHVVTTFALLAFLIPHAVLPMIRNYRLRAAGSMQNIVSAQNRYISRTALFSGVLFALIFLAGYSYNPVELNNEFPEDYNLTYGDKRFAPSLA